MSDRSSYKRNPAIHCWIKHIEEGNYNETQNNIHTIFGKVKRVRLIATIVDKSEKLIETDEFEMDLIDDSKTNVRLIFNLDDATGLIRAYKDKVNPEEFSDYNVGDIVDVVGRVSKKGGYMSLWIEIFNKVEEPNLILLRNAEIINRIKEGDIEEVPSQTDVNNLFEEEFDFAEEDDLKENIFSIIDSHSKNGRGINFERLKKEMKIPDIELRSYLNDLILESRIYESDKDIFESY
ncbi:MAG: hypothetical protein ACFE8B_01760 [Candidatus Hermodarchaeota archaeon]